MAFLGYDRHSPQQLNRQVAGLMRDVGHLSDQLRRAGGHASHDVGHLAHDLGEQALHQGAAAARVAGRSARRAGRAVRRDPVPTVVAAFGVACLLSLIFARGKPRRR